MKANLNERLMNFSCFSVELLTESVPHHRPSLVLFGDNARTASSPKDSGNSGGSNFPRKSAACFKQGLYSKIQCITLY